MSPIRNISLVLTLIFFAIPASDGAPKRSQVDGIDSYGWFSKDDVEWYLRGCDFARRLGYKCEEHEVETEDGYILTLHRIPRGKNSNCEDYNKVLILQHGLLTSSTNFMINSANQSLAYLFADDCYDVWMPNSRGNTYSLKHNMFSTDQERFWEFSFDEMAEYDLPASIDYILKKTSQPSLYYIGHSQGTMIGFVAFSENKDLAKKIRFFGALAPVGYASNMKAIVTSYSSMSDQLIYMTLGKKSFFGDSNLRDQTVTTVCKSETACVKFGEMFGGRFSPNMNTSRLPVYFTHTPAGTSVQNMVHWAQLIRGKYTTKYNYDEKIINVAKYGSMTPPRIHFDKVDLPVAMFSGAEDTISDPTDVERLADELPNIITKVDIDDYSHLDFIYSMDANEKIFSPLSILMSEY